jgi:hypothetical protein
MASYLGRRKFLARLAARAVTATGEEDRADGDARPSQLRAELPVFGYAHASERRVFVRRKNTTRLPANPG